MFSTRIKELFESIVLLRKADGLFALFKACSWETDLWVKLGGFMGKKCKTVKENLHSNKNWLSKNTMWCVAAHQNDVSHMKDLYIQT